ncbi:hypothetical protein EVAR_60598_1 [Eumeta japonica]|uniref:Uncharacterized protein n=1 Tax=Eumeta variegata TaxID=151549 RepID=A0A4C1YEE4_EUMVA|nr:hypothetical protein EVAR_60598_1 [Eumeta japonica]
MGGRRALAAGGGGAPNLPATVCFLWTNPFGYACVCMATPPKLKCMQLMATDAPPIKCSGSGASDTVAANRHLVKLGLIKSERKKTIIDHAATLQEIRRPKKEACAS